jgi:hypothetical protein
VSIIGWQDARRVGFPCAQADPGRAAPNPSMPLRAAFGSGLAAGLLGSDPQDTTDPAPNALISAAFACLDAALTAWVAADGDENLDRPIERAMGVLGG